MFADDAFNKYTKEGAGTLVGNWFEERSIRDATGEGRTVPQRHIPRSGLLKDFTKSPDSGPRAQDNTFERVTGPRVFLKPVPMSKTIGAGEADLTGEKPIAEILQAEGRVDREGPREVLAKTARADAAEEEVQMYEAVVAEKAKQRSFATTTGSVHCRPDETLIERPVFYRHSCQKELAAGSPADRSRALLNAGLEVQSNVHYSNVEGITHARMQLADPRMRSDVKGSAAMGFSAFGRSAEFSKPVGEFIRGLSKDDELQAMYESMKTMNPHRLTSGSKPNAYAFQHIPSLTALKDAIHNRIESTFGRQGYVSLRQHLYDRADADGFVKNAGIVDVLRGPLQLSVEEVSEDALSIYLKQLLSMSKDEMRVTQFMGSLRPVILQRHKKMVIDLFASLGPQQGSAPLGAWLSGLPDEELKNQLVSAFGGQAEADVAGIPVNEATFLELFADLGALMDIEPLLTVPQPE
eukprot:CAMPEP_0178426764 /NCGR_PEP_ID=MMETSP0689_2-20121128/29400_1 /TAXON_ID=160604 /ORGANISM="Amphidinium massartii, Strain CS-259" /LENGTH=465 /DNA_ID=CAMNT_0020048455 /DNA_START=59 /DNA_END=1456 /DNA_ORIENTATION=+